MEAVIKSTINISAQLKNDISGYVDRGVVDSFSSALNEALALYVKELRRKEYDEALSEAGRDKVFLARTLECQGEFDKCDCGVTGQW